MGDGSFIYLARHSFGTNLIVNENFDIFTLTKKRPSETRKALILPDLL
jgi:hypothetical protein